MKMKIEFSSVALSFLLITFFVSAATIHAYPAINSLQIDISPGPYLGRYRINGKRPKCFEDISYLMLGERSRLDEIMYDQDGNALVSGGGLRTTDHIYRFTTAKLIRTTRLIRGERGFFEQLSAITETVEGVSYSFEGTFLDQPERRETGDYTNLRGVIRRFKDGRKVAEAQVEFTKLEKVT